MKNILFFLLLFLTLNNAYSQNQSLKDDIKKIADLTGATKAYGSIKTQMLIAIPTKNQEDFSKEFDNSLPIFLEDFEKFYSSHFTHSEIKEIIKFYETPTGQKLSKNISLMIENPLKYNENWDKKIQEILIKYMQ